MLHECVINCYISHFALRWDHCGLSIHGGCYCNKECEIFMTETATYLHTLYKNITIRAKALPHNKSRRVQLGSGEMQQKTLMCSMYRIALCGT